MSKLRLSKKILAFLLAGTLTAGGTTLVLKHLDDKDLPRVENQNGHTDINPFVNWSVNEEDFVVLDAGDHNSVRTRFQDKKMTYCNENDISLGIIISTNSANETDIYDDVEYAKGIVRDYGIDFPVYLNIDNIVTNDNLNNEMKTKLIKDFLEKCAANNIYVGIHGTDTNLCRVKQYCNITGYDALVVKEKETIDYDGSYIVYQELDGSLVAKDNIAEAIAKKDLNNSNGFANDGSYTISSESELTDVALRYGMSVNEILMFNGITKKDIVENTVLRIPSLIDTTVPTGEIAYKQLESPIRGCDMSYAQASSPNWEQMKEEFEFIILRSNRGLTEDDYFATNASQANINDIPIGAYCFNTYTSADFGTHEEFVKKQEQQADFTISVLKNKKIEYPVYLDIEGLVNETTYKKEDVQAMLEIWVNKMTTSGYIPGIYCNQSTFKYLSNCVDYDISEKLEVWVAGGSQYSSTEGDCTKHTHYSVDEVEPSTALYNEEIGAEMAQSTNIANGPAGDSRGHLDINFSLTDYSSKEHVSAAKTTFDIKEFDRTDWELIGKSAIGIVGGAAIGALAGVIGFKKKNKQNIKVKRKR